MPCRLPASAAEHIGEEIVGEGALVAVEAPVARTLVAFRIGLVIGLLLPFGTGRIDFTPVEADLLGRVAQQVIGGRNLLELVRISRRFVGMEFVRELVECFLDVVFRCLLVDAQYFVVVSFSHC